MPVDRETTLKTAEHLLRQGNVTAAIDEYVRLVADFPRDWNSINVLGDLYVRAGDAERAVTQFVCVADHLFEEGFFPRASALYKKAIRVKNDHDHSLARLVEIADRQGLRADAKAYRRELAKYRPEQVDRDRIVASPEPVAPLADASLVQHAPDENQSDARGDTSSEATLVEDSTAVDLGPVLGALRAQALALPPLPVHADPSDAKDIDVVFEQIRSRAGREYHARASEQYERGMRNLHSGRLREAIDDLLAVARLPILRFKAAASLGRMLLSRDELSHAVDWLERAAEAPPPTPEDRWAVLYDLGDALEHLNEPARARAIFTELESEASEYLDVSDRVARLTRTRQGSSTA